MPGDRLAADLEVPGQLAHPNAGAIRVQQCVDLLGREKTVSLSSRLYGLRRVRTGLLSHERPDRACGAPLKALSPQESTEAGDGLG